MSVVRKRHSREVKLRVVIEALKGEKTLSQLSNEHGVHPTSPVLDRKYKERPGHRLAALVVRHPGDKIKSLQAGCRWAMW